MRNKLKMLSKVLKGSALHTTTKELEKQIADEVELEESS